MGNEGRELQLPYLAKYEVVGIEYATLLGARAHVVGGTQRLCVLDLPGSPARKEATACSRLFIFSDPRERGLLVDEAGG